MADSKPVEADVLGRDAHAVLASLLAEGVYDPSPDELWRRVGAVPALASRAPAHRQPARQRLLVAVSLYFRYFLPPRGWKLLGSEVALAGARLDLLWQDEQSRLIADEVKTGAVTTSDGWRQLEEQVRRQLEAGRERWPLRFQAVRALVLADPGHSFVLGADGQKRSLLEVDDD